MQRGVPEVTLVLKQRLIWENPQVQSRVEGDKRYGRRRMKRRHGSMTAVEVSIVAFRSGGPNFLKGS